MSNVKFVVVVVVIHALCLPSGAEPLSPEKPWRADLLMTTFYAQSGLCEVMFLGNSSAPQAICNFDLGKIQTVDVIETEDAFVYASLLSYSEVSATEQAEMVKHGSMLASGRKADWPDESKLPKSGGPPAFVFCDWEGNTIENPGEDVDYLMETCAEYFESNALKIEEDWQTLLAARAEHARLAAIEAAKPKPPPEPPRVLKIERKPGSAVPGKLRDATTELSPANPHDRGRSADMTPRPSLRTGRAALPHPALWLAFCSITETGEFP